MALMMISCSRATELIDKKEAVGLSRVEHLALRLHTMMCDVCRRYEKQSKTLEALLAKGLEKPAIAAEGRDDRAERLTERIPGKKN